MAQSVSNQFRAALSHLLAQEGRGAQTRLANQQGIDRGYLNAIVKGRKPGSDEIRDKITTHFNLDYEDMLALGRCLLEEQDGLVSGKGQRMDKSAVKNLEVAETMKEVIDFQRLRKRGGDPSSFSSRIVKVLEILESGTSYSDLLVGLIDTFHDSIKINQENLSLRNRMAAMESKLADFEERLDCEAKHTKKSA
ncbi:MAG: hypothetical protein ACD_75C00002G0004 [uncultured bacterium]|nr:MAG: hypothetical protein ACD_75C00002G0004 [uncultured bacterium]